MKCENCNFEIYGNPKFCPECGSKIEYELVNKEENSIKEEKQLEIDNIKQLEISNDEVKSSNSKIIKLISFLLTVVAIVAGISIFEMSKKEQNYVFFYGENHKTLSACINNKTYSINGIDEDYIKVVAVDKNKKYALIGGLSSEKSTSGTLFVLNLKKVNKEQPIKIDEDIVFENLYDVKNFNNVVFCKADSNLCFYSLKDNQTKKISSNVIEFFVNDENTQVVFNKKSDIVLYDFKTKEDTKLAKNKAIKHVDFNNKFVIGAEDNTLVKIDFAGKSSTLVDKYSELYDFGNNGFYYTTKIQEEIRAVDYLEDDLKESDVKFNPYDISKNNIVGTTWQMTYLRYDVISDSDYEDTSTITITNVSNDTATIEVLPSYYSGMKTYFYDGKIKDNKIYFEIEDWYGTVRNIITLYNDSNNKKVIKVEFEIISNESSGFDSDYYGISPDGIYELVTEDQVNELNERNDFRSKISEEILTVNNNVLYYCDMNSVNKVDDFVKQVECSDGNVVIYSVESINKSKIKMSELEDYSISHLIDKINNTSDESYLNYQFAKGKDKCKVNNTIENAKGFVISDNEEIFFINNVDVDNELSSVLLNKNKSEFIKYEKGVYDFTIKTGKQHYVYFIKDVDDDKNGELYLDKKKVADYATLNSAKISEVGKIFYFVDYDTDDRMGTLMLFDGKNSKEIANDVHSFSVSNSKSIMMIRNIDDRDFTGNLDFYKGNSNKIRTIEYGVSDIEVF